MTPSQPEITEANIDVTPSQPEIIKANIDVTPSQPEIIKANIDVTPSQPEATKANIDDKPSQTVLTESAIKADTPDTSNVTRRAKKAVKKRDSRLPSTGSRSCHLSPTCRRSRRPSRRPPTAA